MASVSRSLPRRRRRHIDRVAERLRIAAAEAKREIERHERRITKLRKAVEAWRVYQAEPDHRPGPAK